MHSFMEEYEKTFSEIQGVPGLEMNRPYVQGVVVGDVGLELEVEGRGLPTEGSLDRIKAPETKTRWLAKSDGSLRGEALEYVLSRPCDFSEIEYLVTSLYDKFSSSKTELTLSNRCSTHVHVNMSGKKINEITSAIALWTAFEEPLTFWAGEERVNNHFCLSAKDSNQGTVQAWRAFLRSGRPRFHDNLKYSALNILTLHRFGSIEYRVMNASEDPKRIIDWSKFVFTLTRYAGDQFNNPKSLLYAMSERGGRDLFLDICSRAGVSDEFVLGVTNSVRDINRSVLDGFRRAQPLVAGFDWDAWMPEINKEYVVNPFGEKKSKGGRIDLQFDEDVIARPRGMGDGRRINLVGTGTIAPPPAATRHTNFVERLERVNLDPVRPEVVPESFVWNAGAGSWRNPDMEEIRAQQLQIRRRPARRVSFVDAPRARVDWSKPIQFTDGTPAMVIGIDSSVSMAQVVALDNINTPSYDLTSSFWYNTRDGVWNGGGAGYPVVQNVPEDLV